jgi:hypothetical protein
MPARLPSSIFKSVAFSVLLTAVLADTSPAASTSDCVRFRHTGFWDIDIDNYPALPPACVAPISRNADRNRAHLPAQVAAIFASYAFCAIIIGIAILGIRIKRKHRLAPKQVELKLVINNEKQFEPSIGSPASFVSWMRNPLRRKNAQQSGEWTPRSPGVDSISSFDPRVVDHDIKNRQEEMERLYAAVMAHDEARRSQLSQVTPNLPRASVASSTLTDKRLAQVAHEEYPRSPISPMRAIYPPGHDRFARNLAAPLSPTSPIHTTIPEYPSYMTPGSGLLSPTTPISPTAQRIDLPNDMYPASPPPGMRRMRLPNQPFTPGLMSPATIILPGPKTPVMPETPMGLPMDYPASPTLPEQYNSLYPPEKAPSTSSSKESRDSKGKRILKSMRINTSGRKDDFDAEDRAPLSATYQAEQQQTTEPPSPVSAATQESTDSLGNRASMKKVTTPRRPPNLRIQSPNSSQLSLPSGPKHIPEPPKSAMASGPKKMTFGPKPLALRVAFPEEEMRSPTVKTTVLQHRKEHLTRGGLRTARTPMTGVPQTPYTPYMPFTPITPITPHLVTRTERKALKKMEGKTLLDESDLVKEEDEEEDWS